jgi:hypothetical protein
MNTSGVPGSAVASVRGGISRRGRRHQTIGVVNRGDAISATIPPSIMVRADEVIE